MATLVMVCGPTGAGKTTHSIALAQELGAVRFSIDPWMKTLFEKDLVTLDFAWIAERVERCCDQIWEVSQQILKLDGHVVLDLAFRDKAQRELYRQRATALGVTARLHYLEVPADLRWKRVQERNEQKDPRLYSFEVTDFMFNFMEPRFEAPDDQELVGGRRIVVDR